MSKWILIGIFVLAFLLRVLGLDSLPSGFTPDEASFGYDAYSILKTGHDQWGSRYPLTFKSFGDYKLPLYTYLTVPSIYLFGLNEYAVRLPNAILGSIAVIFVYGITIELTRDKKAALLASLFLAVSYWHISMSRGAFEANLTTFFMSSGVYFFLKARKKDIWLSLSMLLFGLNLFTYHSARLVTPIIVMGLIWLYRDSFPKRKKYMAASVLFLVPMIIAIVSVVWGMSGARASTSTIFSQSLGSGKYRASLVASGVLTPIAHIFYNEPLYKISKFLQNYSSYFSLDFLLNSGARESTYGMVPGIGVLSLLEVGGLILFLISLIRKLDHKYFILVIWLVISVIPAAISVGPGNAANRADIMMPSVQIIAAIGFTGFIRKLNLKQFEKTAYISFFLVTIFVGGLIFVRYYFEQPVVSNIDMLYGMRDTFEYLKQYPSKHIVLSDSLSESHIYAMFYDPIAPNLSQLATKNWDIEAQNVDWVDQQGTYFIGRYTITAPQKSRFEENTLVVARPDEIPTDVRVLKTILSPSKKPIIVIAEKI